MNYCCFYFVEVEKYAYISTPELRPGMGCRTPCGKKSGLCPKYCGENSYCCRKGKGGCTPLMKKAAPPDHHTCMKIGYRAQKGQH